MAPWSSGMTSTRSWTDDVWIAMVEDLQHSLISYGKFHGFLIPVDFPLKPTQPVVPSRPPKPQWADTAHACRPACLLSCGWSLYNKYGNHEIQNCFRSWHVTSQCFIDLWVRVKFCFKKWGLYDGTTYKELFSQQNYDENSSLGTSQPFFHS